MKFLDKIKRNRILVIGDIMLDEYHYGSVNRISPEAPVPVFLNNSSMYRLGGAANVAVNIAINRQITAIMAVIGKDESGKKIRELLENNKISMGHARSLSKLSDEVLINDLADRIINESLSVRDLEHIISNSDMPKNNKMHRKLEDKNIHYSIYEKVMREKYYSIIRMSI